MADEVIYYSFDFTNQKLVEDFKDFLERLEELKRSAPDKFRGDIVIMPQ